MYYNIVNVHTFRCDNIGIICGRRSRRIHESTKIILLNVSRPLFLRDISLFITIPSV